MSRNDVAHPVAVRRVDLFVMMALCWTVLGVVSLAYVHMGAMVSSGIPASFSSIAVYVSYCAIGIVVGFGALTPWARDLSRMSLPVLVVTLFATTLLLTGAKTGLRVLMEQPWPVADMLALEFHPALVDVTMTIGLTYGLQVVAARRRRLLAESQLERDLANARLQLLRVQMQPHFLFNALNGISNAVTAQPLEAQRMITKLAALLRMSLATTQNQMTIVDEEVRFTETYLDLQRSRFGDRLRVVIDVASDVRDIEIPSFLLQPLVENSVRHALEATDGNVEIGVRIRRAGVFLEIEVWDSGRGDSAQRHGGTGLGLSNTKMRLTDLYGDRASLLVSHTPAGTRNQIRLPLNARDHQ